MLDLPLELQVEVAQHSDNPNYILTVPLEIQADVVDAIYQRVPLAVIDFLIDHQLDQLLAILWNRYNFDFTERHLRRALKLGRLNIVALISASGRSMPIKAMDYAGQSGSIALVNYLYHHDYLPTEDTVERAARGGHLALIQHLYAQGARATERALAAAAYHGHVDVMKWLLKPSGQGGGLDPQGLRFINRRRLAASGHANVLQFLDEQLNTVPDEEEYDVAFAHGRRDVLNYLQRYGLTGGVRQLVYRTAALMEAVKAGNRPVVEELLAAGVSADSRLADEAVKCGHLDVLEYLMQRGVRPSPRAMELAIVRGNLNIVGYLFEHGYRVDNPLELASKYGHFEIVNEFLSLGYQPWIQVLYNAAKYGSLHYTNLFLQQVPTNDSEAATVLHHAVLSGQQELVKYLVEEHPTVSRVANVNDVVDEVCRAGNYQVLTYLETRGAVGDRQTLHAAIEHGHASIVNWHVQHGVQPLPIESNYVNHLDVAKIFLQLFTQSMEWDVSTMVDDNNYSLLVYLTTYAGLQIDDAAEYLNDAIRGNRLIMVMFLIHHAKRVSWSHIRTPRLEHVELYNLITSIQRR